MSNHPFFNNPPPPRMSYLRTTSADPMNAPPSTLPPSPPRMRTNFVGAMVLHRPAVPTCTSTWPNPHSARRLPTSTCEQMFTPPPCCHHGPVVAHRTGAHTSTHANARSVCNRAVLVNYMQRTSPGQPQNHSTSPRPHARNQPTGLRMRHQVSLPFLSCLYPPLIDPNPFGGTFVVFCHISASSACRCTMTLRCMRRQPAKKRC
jgi:hypothetical protein